MKRALPAFVAAALATAQAHAGVVFNWVQTGTPSPVNQTLPFAVTVADDVYTAALASPVTLAAYSARIGVEQASPSYVQAQVLTADVQAAVRVVSASSGEVQIVSLAQGLSQCNSPPWFALSCRVGFTSTAAQPNGSFVDFFHWGGGLPFIDGFQNSSFTLSGNVLSTSFTFMRSFGDGATISTDSQGAGAFALLTDGSPTQLRGTGYWAVDASTIPAAVPVPPSAWLMAAGIAGIALLRVRPSRP